MLIYKFIWLFFRLAFIYNFNFSAIIFLKCILNNLFFNVQDTKNAWVAKSSVYSYLMILIESAPLNLTI